MTVKSFHGIISIIIFNENLTFCFEIILKGVIRLENVKENSKSMGFMQGLKDGLPVGLGYIPISIACGIMAIKVGLNFGIAELLSALIYSGSGQAAAQTLYAGCEASILMYALTIFVMNCRYVLFSISIAQKFDKDMGPLQRIIFGFFNTDEIYVVAMKQKGDLNFPYLMGLATLPYLGFFLGNTFGLLFTNLMPDSVKSALGIMLYAMFIALVVPPAKHSKPMAIVTVIAIAMSIFMECIPAVKACLGSGIIIIICAVVTATIGALAFPIKESEESVEGGAE